MDAYSQFLQEIDEQLKKDKEKIDKLDEEKEIVAAERGNSV
jgi:hypothetical protein